LGGVGKYALSMDRVHRFAPVKIYTLCILGRNWWYDKDGLDALDAQKIFIKSRLDISWLRKVPQFVNKLKPDLIMTHGFNGHFVALVTRMLTQERTVLICSYHGSYHATTPGKKLIEPIYNHVTNTFIRHSAMSCVSVASFTKRFLVKKGVLDKKIVVIHNGIDAQRPSSGVGGQIRKEWRIDGHEIVVGVASRLDSVKGIHFLIDAMNVLIKRYKNLKLVIIGTGTSEQDLKSRVDNHGIGDKVLFLGYRSDVPACLEAMDIFVLPSVAEYHSIGLLEAMRAGKTIIATNVGGNTESVRHMKEGIIVPPADVTALVEAIARIIDDPLLGDRLGEASELRFRQFFTEEVMIRRTTKWLLKCGKLARNLTAA